MLVVTFRVAASAYALRCDDIVAVIPEVELRPLAQSAPCLRGVFAYRGELTPVVDVCQLIAGYRCPARLSSRIALVRVNLADGSARTLGLLAEHMTEARRLEGELMASQPMAAIPYFGELRLVAGEPLQFIEVSGLALAAASAPARIGSREEDREPAQP